MTTIFSIDRQVFCLVVGIWGMTFGVPIREAGADPPRLPLSVRWRLLDNRPDERFRSEIELRNDGKVALESDWALYFNCERNLLPESVGKEFELTHVNGDLYVLRPTPGSKSLAAGERRAIPLEGLLWAINVSDAPNGFYIVLKEKSGQQPKPISLPLEIEPFPEAAKLNRGKADVVPVVNAESR